MTVFFWRPLKTWEFFPAPISLKMWYLSMVFLLVLPCGLPRRSAPGARRGCPGACAALAKGCARPCARSVRFGQWFGVARLIKFEPVRVLWTALFVHAEGLCGFREPSRWSAAVAKGVRAGKAAEGVASYSRVTPVSFPRAASPG